MLKCLMLLTVVKSEISLYIHVHTFATSHFLEFS